MIRRKKDYPYFDWESIKYFMKDNPNFNADKFIDMVGKDKITEDGIVVDELTIGIE